MAGLALLVLMLADALLASRLIDLKLVAPSDVEVGQPAEVSVHAEFSRTPGVAPVAALGFDPRLGARGAAELELGPGPVPDTRHGTIELISNRRGTGLLQELW